MITDNTIGAAVQYFKKALSGHLAERELVNITHVVFDHLFSMNRADLVVNADRRISESEFLEVKRIKDELLEGVPIQYIIGSTIFMGLDLKVSPAVLIPRPETEELVKWILDSIDLSAPKILDIGTGSGCIALGLKAGLPKSEVEGWDVSPEALEIAKSNGDSNNQNVTWREVDIINPPTSEGSFDIIASNPPYITQQEQESMSRSVIDHEPSIALFVPDSDPLQFYRAIIDFAGTGLRAEGQLYFEINPVYADDLQELLLSRNFRDVELKNDLQGRGRMMRAIRSK